MKKIRNIIVIGASSGGISAIKEVINGLPQNINAAVVVVIHVSIHSNCSIIASILQNYTSLTCVVASNGQVLQKGHLYLAPAGHQMMLKEDSIVLTHGPYENKYRPAIDVLFRSAAVYYGNRVIGVILTGLLDDGTSGMYAIKKSGGLCIVQDPSDASFPDMPNSVINKITVDYILPVTEIAETIMSFLAVPLPPEVPISKEIEIEVEIVENMVTDESKLKKIGEKSDFVCPDCEGELYTLKEEPIPRYSCYTGHVYTEKVLDEIQDG
ncbi:MAG: chemotaxis protein CheB, partial [Flavobacterium sp.]